MSQTPPVDLPAVDNDVDAATPIFDELAPAWAALQALLAEEVPADATA